MVGCAYPFSYVHSHSVSDLHLANAASTGISAGDIAMHLDDLISLPIGAAVSAVGLAVGTGIEKLRARKKRED